MSKNDHEQYEYVSSEDYWKLTICPNCKALLLKYDTQSGGSMKVTIHFDMSYHRYGNHNNMIAFHDCAGDKRASQIREPLRINCIPVTEEVKQKVHGAIQQQAIMTALTEYSKPRIRSSFKKGMLKQAQDFLAGNTAYKNPYSPKQALAIIMPKPEEPKY
jgi:hypothetical protein